MIGYHLEGGGGRRGGSLEIGRPRLRGWKNFGRSWTKVVGGLENCENWTIFINVICISSLTYFRKYDRLFNMPLDAVMEGFGIFQN